MSQYLCIGRFSAVSFQVLGHMKTVCVLVLGWVLFDSALTLKNILGMAVAVIGMVIYSWAVELEKAAPRIKDNLSDEDINLLKEGGVEESTDKDVEMGESKLWRTYSSTCFKSSVNIVNVSSFNYMLFIFYRFTPKSLVPDKCHYPFDYYLSLFFFLVMMF